VFYVGYTSLAYKRGMCVCVFFRLGYPTHGMPEKDSSSNTLEIQGVAIHATPAEPFHPSKERITAARFGKDFDQIAEVLSMTCEWINLPILQDSFEDHAERRAWEEGLDAASSIFLDENKIGANQWFAVYLQLGMLKKSVTVHEPELGAKIDKLIKDVPGIIERLNRYKNEGAAAREAYLAAIHDLDAVARAVVTAVTR